MFKSAALSLYRSLSRHPLYAALNLLGLSLGIAVFLVLSLYVQFENGFERWIPGADRLYFVGVQYRSAGDFGAFVHGGLLDELRADYPDLTGVRIWSQPANARTDAEAFSERETFVDANFLQVIGLDLTAGDPRRALSAPSNVVISQAIAEKYFGKANALGRTLSLTDIQGRQNFVVAGVFKTPPMATDFTFDILRLLTPTVTARNPGWEAWGRMDVQVILRLDHPERAAQLNRAFDAFTDRKAGNIFAGASVHKILHLQVFPLPAKHLMDSRLNAMVSMFGGVAALALLIAAINFVNLATARAGLRAREVAIRKALGATQAQLRTQFLWEAVLLTLIAAVIGFSAVEVALPAINAFCGLSLALDYQGQWPDLLATFAVLAIMGLLSGIYPALVLSAFQPAAVLASNRTPAGGRFSLHLREGLVVIQFALVTGFFAMILSFAAEVRHLKTDVGFERDGLLLAPSTANNALTPGQRRSLWTAFRALPGVKSLTAADQAPGSLGPMNGDTVYPEGFKGGEAEAPNINSALVGPDFFTTYGARLLAGRLLSPDYGADRLNFDPNGADAPTDASRQPEHAVNIVLNENAAKLIGYASPQAAIGQILHYSGHAGRALRIVGVIANMRFREPVKGVNDYLYFLDIDPQSHPITALRYAGVSEAQMRARVTEIWRRIAPETPEFILSAQDSLDRLYRTFSDIVNLFTLGAFAAAMVGIVGLYGLAAFNTSRRKLEIALRKVLGAASGSVARLMVLQFIRPVLLANLLAWPLAYIVLRGFFSTLSEAVELNVFYFLAASFAAAAIAIVTVGGLAFASAAAAPGPALRQE